MNKKALIFGVTGQDGSYLAGIFIKKEIFCSWCCQKIIFN